MEVSVNATKSAVEDFKESILWKDIVTELNNWKQAFNYEMMTIVDEAAETNPSSASVLLHMGDLHGRQKAVDYMLGIPDMFLQLIEDRKPKEVSNE